MKRKKNRSPQKEKKAQVRLKRNGGTSRIKKRTASHGWGSKAKRPWGPGELHRPEPPGKMIDANPYRGEVEKSKKPGIKQISLRSGGAIRAKTAHQKGTVKERKNLKANK